MTSTTAPEPVASVITSTVPVLEVRDLAVEFDTPAGPVRAVDGVSFSVLPGEVLGIVGESGSGKSVTNPAVMGLLPPNGRIVSGEILFRGEDLRAASPARRRELRGGEIAMVFQDPMTALNPVKRVGGQIDEMIKLHDHRLDRSGRRQRAVDLLTQVGVPEPARRYRNYPHQFSGGMRQRAVIATAMAHDPALLIADEPTTALDVTIQAQVMAVLSRVRGAVGSSMILVTHDLGLVAQTADRVVVMYSGRVAETGAVEEIFHAPNHPYTIGLLRSLLRTDTTTSVAYAIPGHPPALNARPSGCAFRPRCEVGRDRADCAETIPVPLPVAGAGNPSTQTAACLFPTEARTWADEPLPIAKATGPISIVEQSTVTPPHRAAEVLRVDDLATYFPAGRGAVVKAVDGVSFSLRAGETLGLVGESGCGKSTLVRTVLGLHKPTRGAVSLGGRQLTRMGPRELRRQRPRMQVVFQDPATSLDPRMSVHDIVAEPLRINRRYEAKRVRELLDQVGLGTDAERRKPSEFSGGQRQRIGIARALALNPELLILDEPVSALDVSIQAQVINLLAELQRELGLAYLFIAHDLSVVRHVSTRVAVMYLGRIVELGTREQIFDDPQHPYTRSLLSAIPVPEPRGREGRRQTLLTGDLPSPTDPPSGCPFRTRCPKAQAACAETTPLPAPGDGRSAACLFAPDDLFVTAPVSPS